MIRFMIAFILLLDSFSFCCSYVWPNPHVLYPLQYRPGTLVYLEGVVDSIVTEPCSITTIDKKPLEKELDSLIAEQESIVDPFTGKDISNLSTQEKAVWKKVKREKLIKKLKVVRVKNQLKKDADTTCMPSKFYLQVSTFLNKGNTQFSEFYFTIESGLSASCQTTLIRATNDEMIGKRVYFLCSYPKEYITQLSEKQSAPGNNVYRFTLSSADWRSSNSNYEIVKEFDENHKYKTLYFLLKNLYEARSYSKKFRLVKKHKDLFLFNGRLGEGHYREMVKLNFPDATEEQIAQLLALKNLN